MRIRDGRSRRCTARRASPTRGPWYDAAVDWDDVRHFLALARLGSVRAAGAALGVSHSTVARRVEALEGRLAARLFDRSRDGYVLTDAGREMLPAAERVEEEMAALERGLVGRDERLAGPVNVTCCDGFVAELVLGDLRPFLDAHPEIELTFTTDTRPFDLSKREADLAIRILAREAQPPAHLIGRRVAPLVIASYVSEAHADRLDPDRPGTAPRWLAGTDWAIQDMLVHRASYPRFPIWGRFSSLELIAQAAVEGLGLAMLPTYAGDRVPGLRRLAKPDLRHLADLWLLCHPDLRDNARVRAMRQHLAGALAARRPTFEGEG